MRPTDSSPWALQDHSDVLAERALDPHAFIEIECDAFIRMVADALIKFGADLVKLQQPVCAGGNGHPRQRVGVDHAVGVFPGHMDRAMNGKSRRVCRGAALDDLTLHIDHD